VKKLLAITFVIICSGGFGKSASADIGYNMNYFLNSFNGDKNTKFSLECFQNGKTIISKDELYVRPVREKDRARFWSVFTEKMVG
jgi:hypothetical protein